MQTAKTAKTAKKPKDRQPANTSVVESMAENTAMAASENGIPAPSSLQQRAMPPRRAALQSGMPAAPTNLVEVQNAVKSLKEVLNLADGKMTRLQQALSEVPQ